MLIVGVSVISLAVARAPVVRFAPIVHPESHLAQALIALVTLTLLFNVFFNYYHAIVGQPGSVAHLPKPINPRPFEENETETTTTGATSHDGVAEDSEDTAPEVTRGTFAGVPTLRPVRRGQTPGRAPLQDVPHVRQRHGPPLPVHCELRRR